MQTNHNILLDCYTSSNCDVHKSWEREIIHIITITSINNTLFFVDIVFSLDTFLFKTIFAAPPSSHPPVPFLNKPSSSSSSHSPTFYLCCTWEMRGGWERRWMKQGVGNEREEKTRRARLGKCPLTGFKSLWHFIFRESGASSPSDPLRAKLID